MISKNGTPPSYVLLCNGQQVGAMNGSADQIVFLEIFPSYQGVKHSEIFLELLENVARSQGVKCITMGTPTIEPRFWAALERCGFDLQKEEPDGNRWYCRNL